MNIQLFTVANLSIMSVRVQSLTTIFVLSFQQGERRKMQRERERKLGVQGRWKKGGKGDGKRGEVGKEGWGR